MENNRRKEDQTGASLDLVVQELRSFHKEYEADKRENIKRWEQFYEFKDNLKQPTSFKDAVYTVLITLGVVSALSTAVYAIVDFRTAVPIENGKNTAVKVDAMDAKLNKIVNTLSLAQASLSSLNEKASSNKDFVDDFMFVKQYPSTIEVMKNDIENLKQGLYNAKR